mmetsp:Transcript_14784/g.24648  ORF Transcript_14784/g.24648 Transcript_14784/m.24648 type:complete len:122 (-) Transcript_14784:311-676(-)
MREHNDREKSKVSLHMTAAMLLIMSPGQQHMNGATYKLMPFHQQYAGLLLSRVQREGESENEKQTHIEDAEEHVCSVQMHVGSARLKQHLTCHRPNAQTSELAWASQRWVQLVPRRVLRQV